MNLNETCILKFLINPDEIHELSKIFIKNIEEAEKKEAVSVINPIICSAEA